MPGQYNYPGANVPGVPGVPTQMPEGMTPLQQQIWMKAFGGGIPGVTGMPNNIFPQYCFFLSVGLFSIARPLPIYSRSLDWAVTFKTRTIVDVHIGQIIFAILLDGLALWLPKNLAHSSTAKECLHVAFSIQNTRLALCQWWQCEKNWSATFSVR